ncbi:MAG: hypothetical protein M3Q57_02850 [Pseudomonadota bacterium]|nr:hypothetical protein [Pseudomonadota bacterium]
MNRALTLLAASACAAVAVSSACFAAESRALDFRLGKTGNPATVQFHMVHGEGSKQSGNWSQSVALGELQGLGAAQFNASTSTPIRFALVRPAGRFDCSGTIRSSDGRGTCAFAADDAFSATLARRGVGRPSRDQSYKLALSNFRVDVLDALAAAAYPAPTIDQAIALGIFKINPAYVDGLSRSGYRLGSIDDLVGFKIHGVSPELISAYRSLGYRQLSADDLTAMAIHGVTPGFIRGFASLGYRDLPADKLVELKIFNVTPGDVRALQTQGMALPSADQLVRRRLGGFGSESRRRGD